MGETFNFSRDPVCAADYVASDADDWLTFFSEWRTRLTNGWTNVFMNATDPDLAHGLLKGARFTMYQVQGTTPYFGNWTVTRRIGSVWPANPPARPHPQYY